jgi:hypothetical protein
VGMDSLSRQEVVSTVSGSFTSQRAAAMVEESRDVLRRERDEAFAERDAALLELERVRAELVRVRAGASTSVDRRGPRAALPVSGHGRVHERWCCRTGICSCGGHGDMVVLLDSV